MKREILVSIHPEHVQNIASGEKTVELRRTNFHWMPGETLWIYTTAPVSAIELVAKVGFCVRASPKEIWRQYGKRLSIRKSEFDLYASERIQLTAIEICSVRSLEKRCSLFDLREASKNFQPPQGAIYAERQTRLLKVLEPLRPAGWSSRKVGQIGA